MNAPPIKYQTVGLVSFSTIAVGLLMMMYLSQYVRPQDLFLGNKAPFYSLFNYLLLIVLIMHGGTYDAFIKSAQLRWMTFIVGWSYFLVLFNVYWFPELILTRGSTGIINDYIFDTAFIVQLVGVYAIVALLNTPYKLRAFISFIAGCAVFLSLFVLWKQIGNFGRYQMIELANFLKDPNECSLYFNMMLPFVIVGFLFGKNWIEKIYFGVGIISVSSVSLLTYSRGGFLGFLLTVGAFSMLHPRRWLIIALVVFCGVGVFFWVGNEWLELMSTATDATSRTAITRITTWKASLELFLDNPLGLGAQVSPSFYYQYINDGILGMKNYEWRNYLAHSFWFTALADWGLVGISALLWVVFLNVRDAWRLTQTSGYFKLLGMAFLASLLGFCAAASFITVNYYPHFWYMTALLSAVVIHTSIHKGR